MRVCHDCERLVVKNQRPEAPTITSRRRVAPRRDQFICWMLNPTHNLCASLSWRHFPLDDLRIIPAAAAEVMYSFHVRRKRNILFQQNALMRRKAGWAPGPLRGLSAAETKATGSLRW